ncbi:tagaturonate epimerase family protein [Ignisphaera sp. 4213-co]|uniref:Tagaturonate epimerase family protein n=1 Tax=Ignisphaera cupida TaxID=3050454 RepID=A0ABD4Z7F9_9CREN|nr:tagaturonate epimerase family protein [Ignisphaera sp. 4213-co]MDK6028639.1 tagaturonate epimerase family protein [Ignisphaera sp. 4213-co]
MYLGKLPRPAFGIRIPDIVASAMLKAFKSLNIAGTFMLSFNRETAPTSYIQSSDPKLFYFGHTGTSIEEYISKGRGLGELYGSVIEIEADHVSIMGSVERALKKIAGVSVAEPLSDSEIEFSLQYIEEEFREVKRVGGVDFVTIDTCELIDYSIDLLSDKDVLDLYENRIDVETRKEMERLYLKAFTFVSGDRQIRIKYDRLSLARLVLKYQKSIEYVKKVLDIIKKYNEKEFGVEVAFDETPKRSEFKDVLFYVLELRRAGIEPDFLAPNIGFRKREDYEDNIEELYNYLRNIHTILYSNNVLISIHSGSGHNPYSDKGFGVWRVVGEATQGMVKYKMSGVFIQLLLEVMSRFPPGSKTRRLYEEIYDGVIEHLRQVVKSKATLYSQELEKLLEKYDKCGECYKNPRADVFRHYFYVFQALRDFNNKRFLRDEVINHYMSTPELQRIYEKEVLSLVERLARSIGYENNLLKYRALVIQ